MSGGETAVSELGPEHCRAICEEIGERLRYALPPVNSVLPMRIAALLDRLAELDELAPSIVPSLEEIAEYPLPRRSLTP